MDERIYGLLGRKLGHSWSVPIHAALGNGAYRLLELEPDGLAPFLHRKDIGGLNVTRCGGRPPPDSETPHNNPALGSAWRSPPQSVCSIC